MVTTLACSAWVRFPPLATAKKVYKNSDDFSPSLHKVTKNGARHDNLRDPASPLSSKTLINTNTGHAIYGETQCKCKEWLRTQTPNYRLLNIEPSRILTLVSETRSQILLQLINQGLANLIKCAFSRCPQNQIQPSAKARPAGRRPRCCRPSRGRSGSRTGSSSTRSAGSGAASRFRSTPRAGKSFRP